jgi:5-hydroxyisourate hydrolase-like protein (transthyretin family)
MRISLTRAIAGTAIAAVAALTVAGTASAATNTTPAKAPTTLSLTQARATIVVGQKDVLTGTLLSGKTPVVNKVVELYRYRVSDKKWVPVEVDLTGKFGHVFFGVRPATTTTYKLIFRGSAKFAASRSNLATVRVVPAKAPTTLGIAVSSGSITAGQKDLITGTLLSRGNPVAGKVVNLYRYSTSAKKWIRVEVDLTGKFGHVFYTVKPSATTTYELVFFGTAHLRASHSDVATITVTP